MLSDCPYVKWLMVPFRSVPLGPGLSADLKQLPVDSLQKSPLTGSTQLELALHLIHYRCIVVPSKHDFYKRTAFISNCVHFVGAVYVEMVNMHCLCNIFWVKYPIFLMNEFVLWIVNTTTKIWNNSMQKTYVPSFKKPCLLSNKAEELIWFEHGLLGIIEQITSRHIITSYCWY